MNEYNYDYNFIVTQTNFVVERQNVGNWHINKLMFPENYVMVYTLDGECNYTIGNDKYCAKPGDVYIFAPNIVRSGISSPQNPWSFISINFNISSTNGGSAVLPDFITGLTENAGSSVRQNFIDISSLWIKRSTAYLLRCRTLTQNILCNLIINNSNPYYYTPHYNKINNAKKYIQNNYTLDININDLICESGLSPAQFRKLFKQIVGFSPNQYIIFLKLNKAKSLLESGEVNVSEAAYISGFSDVFYFSSVFKKKIGLTPSQVLKLK